MAKPGLSKRRGPVRTALVLLAAMLLVLVVAAAICVMVIRVEQRTYRAAEKGDIQLLEALAQRDPSIDRAVNWPGSCKGWRPLIIAAAEGQTEAIQVLLRKGANPDVTNAKGRTALMFAAHYGYAAIVDALLDAGARPDITPNEGPKAIVAAGLAGRAAPIVSILNKGGTISAKDCEPDRQDGCVRIGWVLGAVLFDYKRAGELNQPLCDAGYRRSCAIASLSGCILKFVENRKAPTVNASWDIIKGCLPTSTSECVMKTVEGGRQLSFDVVRGCAASDQLQSVFP